MAKGIVMNRIASRLVFSVAVLCCCLFLAAPTGFAQNPAASPDKSPEQLSGSEQVRTRSVYSECRKGTWHVVDQATTTDSHRFEISDKDTHQPCDLGAEQVRTRSVYSECRKGTWHVVDQATTTDSHKFEISDKDTHQPCNLSAEPPKPRDRLTGRASGSPRYKRISTIKSANPPPKYVAACPECKRLADAVAADQQTLAQIGDKWDHDIGEYNNNVDKMNAGSISDAAIRALEKNLEDDGKKAAAAQKQLNQDVVALNACNEKCKKPLPPDQTRDRLTDGTSGSPRYKRISTIKSASPPPKYVAACPECKRQADAVAADQQALAKIGDKWDHDIGEYNNNVDKMNAGSINDAAIRALEKNLEDDGKKAAAAQKQLNQDVVALNACNEKCKKPLPPDQTRDRLTSPGGAATGGASEPMYSPREAVRYAACPECEQLSIAVYSDEQEHSRLAAQRDRDRKAYEDALLKGFTGGRLTADAEARRNIEALMDKSIESSRKELAQREVLEKDRAALKACNEKCKKPLPPDQTRDRLTSPGGAATVPQTTFVPQPIERSQRTPPPACPECKRLSDKADADSEELDRLREKLDRDIQSYNKDINKTDSRMAADFAALRKIIDDSERTIKALERKRDQDLAALKACNEKCKKPLPPDQTRERLPSPGGKPRDTANGLTENAPASPSAKLASVCDECKRIRDIIVAREAEVAQATSDWERDSNAANKAEANYGRGSAQVVALRKTEVGSRNKKISSEDLLNQATSALDHCYEKCFELCPNCSSAQVHADWVALVQQEGEIDKAQKGSIGYEVAVKKWLKLKSDLDRDRAELAACIEKCCTPPKTASNIRDTQQPPLASVVPAMPALKTFPAMPSPAGKSSPGGESQGPGALGPSSGGKKSAAPSLDLAPSAAPTPFPDSSSVPRCDGTDVASLPLPPGNKWKDWQVNCAPCAENVRKYNVAMRQTFCLVQRENAIAKIFAQENRLPAGTVLSAEEKKKRYADSKARLEPYAQDVRTKSAEAGRYVGELMSCQNRTCQKIDIRVQLPPPPKIVPPPMGP
jgi:hypothetical protein